MLKIAVSYLVFVLLVFNIINLKAQNKKSYSDSIDILHYDINLNMLKMGAKHIDGYTVLKITPKVNNVTYLSLDLLSLITDSVLINQMTVNFIQSGEKLIITLSNTISIGDTINVSVYYGGHPVKDASDWGGFYFDPDSISAFNLGVGFAANPHNYGRVWFPCNDDFTDRATYDCYIRVNALSKAVCGGLLISENDNGDNTKTFHWQLTDPIPTYLASVAVGRYAHISDIYHGIDRDIPIELYVRHQDSLKAIGSFSHLKQALQIFETHFGPYKWQRVGYVGVSFNSGAMEHATNIAYPNAVIDGSTTYDDLMSHELFHHWFGDLITCSTEGDMWINEGWATFAQFIFYEGLYGKDYVKNYIRTMHKQVLQMAHNVDGSYLPLYGIPTALTYCTTVYDKGALVASNLRAYLGDSLFFNTMTTFLASHNFKDVSSFQFRDYITSYTQRDMTNFFDNWVFTGGFPHFSIDSLAVTNLGNGHYDTHVFVRQKLNGRNIFSNSNIVEITFANNNWQFVTDTLMVSGQYMNKNFNLNFNPARAFLNFDEKSCFGATSFTKVIKQTGAVTFSETHFTTNITQVTDSVLLRVTHNWVHPDSMKFNNPNIVRLSDYRYWTIEGINLANMKANGRFFYNRSKPLNSTFSNNSWLDNTLFSVSADSLLLLYRANTADDWKIQQFTRVGNNVTGYITTDTLKEGQYVFAIGKPANNSLNENIKESNPFDLNIIPNPSDGDFKISFAHDFEGLLKITDSKGEVMKNVDIKKGTFSYNWSPGNIPNGIYLVAMQSSDNKRVTKKIVYQK